MTESPRATPDQGSAELSEPEGWRLVPIEPTVEMCLADWNVSMSDAHSNTGVSRCAWEAMLAAAPRYEPEDATTQPAPSAEPKARAWDLLAELVRGYKVESAREYRLDEMAKALVAATQGAPRERGTFTPAELNEVAALPDQAVAAAFRDVAARNYSTTYASLFRAHVIEKARALATQGAPTPAQADLWVIFDSQGYYRTDEAEESARLFCEHFNKREVDPLKPYTYRRYVAAGTAGDEGKTGEMQP